jgi:hypothetical protein
MQVKLWQVIWLLLKQWRDWNKPVDFVGLIAGLRKFGVKTATYEQLEAIQLQEFLDSIENPTPEQVEQNIRLTAPRLTPPVLDEETRAKNLEIDFAALLKRVESKSPEEQDSAFWRAAYRLSVHNPEVRDALDIRYFRKAIAKKRELVERFGQLDWLETPEDIVPGELPIQVNVAPTVPQEKHVLDND